MKNRNIIIVILIILISGLFFTSCGSSDSELEKALENGNVSSHGGFSVTVNSGSGDGSYLAGVDVTIEADTAPMGQEFDRWIVTFGDPAPTIVDESASSTTLTMLAGDTTVTATYKNLPSGIYTLTVNSGSGDGNYVSGDIVTITADPAPEGQEFDRWVVNSGDPEPTIVAVSALNTTLTMAARHTTVTATYKYLPPGVYTLTVNGGSGGGSYLFGATVAIEANVTAGHVFDYWEVNSGSPIILESNAASTDLTMPANVSEITAKYKYTLVVLSGSGDGSYSAGEVVTLEAAPAPIGQEFDKWTGGDSLISDVNVASTTLTMSASAATVIATYKNLQYDLTVNGGSGGGSHLFGTTVAIEANVTAGYVFDYWEVNSGSPNILNINAASTDLTMPANGAEITAKYKYTLTVLSGSGDGSYSAGDVVAIEADPTPNGQEFDRWIGDVSYIDNSNVSSTTLTMPASAVTVTATYRYLPIANAGDDIEVGDYDDLEITLDGRTSSDSGTGPLAYSWVIVSQPDPIIYFDDATLSMPSFTPIAIGTYVIELKVNNGISDSHPDTVIVNVIPDVTNTFGMEFKFIQGGTFQMGDDEFGPIHNVTLTQSFYMQTTEVTQGQWESVLNEAESMGIGIGELNKSPSYFTGNTTYPVEQVSWDDIKVFIGILNQLGEGTYRLPTEAEWEYACRSGSTTEYANGDGESVLDSMGWYGGNSDERTHPVAQKDPNAWGLYDMHGNVAECCEDWYLSYPSEDLDVIDPTGPLTSFARVIRGDSWSNDAYGCRSANRYYYSPIGRTRHLGFRLSRAP